MLQGQALLDDGKLYVTGVAAFLITLIQRLVFKGNIYLVVVREQVQLCLGRVDNLTLHLVPLAEGVLPFGQRFQTLVGLLLRNLLIVQLVVDLVQAVVAGRLVVNTQELTEILVVHLLMTRILERCQEGVDAWCAHLFRYLRDTTQILRITLVHRQEVAQVLVQHHHLHLTRAAPLAYRQLQAGKQRRNDVVHLVLISLRETHALVGQVLQGFVQIVVVLRINAKLLRRYLDGGRVTVHLLLREEHRKALAVVLVVDTAQNLVLHLVQDASQNTLLKHREVAADLRPYHGVIEPVLRQQTRFLLLQFLVLFLFLLCHIPLYIIYSYILLPLPLLQVFTPYVGALMLHVFTPYCHIYTD